MKPVIKTIRDIIPVRYRPAALEAFLWLRALPYLGAEKQCPCCGWRLRRFMAHHNPKLVRKVVPFCPRCHSNERHRWVWLYLREYTPILTANLRVLYFASEYCLYRLFQRMPNLHVIGTDILRQARVAVQQDITRLAFPDQSFDAVLCNHVLEHVPDDRRAMRELFRVLKPGGWAVLNVPVRMDQPTYEDFSITNPAERERAFGQIDHVRWYGYDYVDRLQEVGFAVEVIYAHNLPLDTCERYGLRSEEVMFFCARPA